jgi:predicted  nucleic acid-binding Zn-ribbon protein
MRKTIFILFSMLLIVSIVAIPADTVRARTASPPPLSPPSPAQQEDEEAIIRRMLGQLDEAKDILDELKQAEQLTEDMDIRDQIDDIIEKVKTIEGLIKAGQNEAALEEKRALSEELEVLAMGYGPGETEAMTRADLDELTKARDELIAASEKISNLGPEEALTKDVVDEVRDILKELGFDDDLGSDDSTGVVTTEGTALSPTGPEVGKPVEAEVDKITVQNAIVQALLLLNLAIRTAETKLALHRVNGQLVLAFHTLQELIAAELSPAEEEEKPIEVEVAPPEVGPVEPIPEVPRAVLPGEEPEEEEGEGGEAVDEHMKILEKLRQEAEVKAGEKDKSEEEAQKSQEAFEKLDKWMETVVRREVVEEEPAEPVETEMVPLELVGPGPIEVHIEMPPSEEEALTPVEFSTSTRIDVSMFRAITENTEAVVKFRITGFVTDELAQGDTDVLMEGTQVGIRELIPIPREVVIEIEGSEVILIGEGAEAATTLPLVIEENKLYAGEDENLYPISLLPGDIVIGLEIAPEEISLESDENQNPVYKVLLDEEGKLFGFLPLELPLAREVTIDTASGDVLSIVEPWWAFSVSKQDIPNEIPSLAIGRPTTREDCDSIRKEYEKLSRQIDERKKECNCDDLKRELDELEAELANAEKDLEFAKQRKAELEQDLAATQKEFNDLFQKIQDGLGGVASLHEYQDFDEVVGRGIWYISYRRLGVPGGLAILGDDSLIFEIERIYRENTGDELSKDLRKVKDLRAERKLLEDKIKESDDEIEEIENKMAEMEAKIAQKKIALDACIQACRDEIGDMEQKRDALVKLHEECVEKLEKERKEREAQGEIDGAGKKIEVGENEAKDAEDEISKAQDEIDKRVDAEEAQEKLDDVRNEYDEAQKELEEAKKKLEEAQKSCEDGDFEKAIELAEEAAEKAENAYKKSVAAKQRAKSARSSAEKKELRCEPAGASKKTGEDTKFIWEKMLGIVKVPFVSGSAPGERSKREIEEQLEAMEAHERAKNFIGWIDLIRSGLQIGGSVYKTPTGVAKAIRLGEEITIETLLSDGIIGEIFKIWKDIMNRYGWEIYIKVEGRKCKIESWQVCDDNGEWVKELRRVECSDSEIRYEYLGVIQKHSDLPSMKEQLRGLLKSHLGGMIEKGSLSPGTVKIE